MSNWHDEPDEFVVMNWDGDNGPSEGETLALPDRFWGGINVFTVQATRQHEGRLQVRLVHLPGADPAACTWRDPFTTDEFLDLAAEAGNLNVEVPE